MAQFEPAFEKMIQNEGGYVLHNVEGDRGGMTYAGIARNMHPKWEGWALIDRGEKDGELTALVRKFYRVNFWNVIKGDEIQSQDIAECIFDFGVNTGTGVAKSVRNSGAGRWALKTFEVAVLRKSIIPARDASSM